MSGVIVLDAVIESFPELLSLKQGNPKQQILGLCSPEAPKSNHMCFIFQDQVLNQYLSQEEPGILVVGKNSASHPALATANLTALLVSPNPALAMAKVAEAFFPRKAHVAPFAGSTIHPSATVATSAQIHTSAVVGPGAVVGENCVIGAHSFVGANCVLEPGVQIGQHTTIFPLVYLAREVIVGNHCVIKSHSSLGGDGFGFAHDSSGAHYKITHYGGLIVEDHVHIGSGVQIDRGTFADSRIGAGVIIDNHCHFGHNIQIGAQTVITGGALVAGSTQIGRNCVIGGRTSITGHISIGDQCHFAGLSGVTKSVTGPGAYGGYPLQPLKAALKSHTVYAQLPKMRQQITRILAALNLKHEKDPT